MASPLKRLVRPLGLASLVLPAALALSWTCRPAALAGWALLNMEPVRLAKADWTDGGRLLEMRRQVQRHFLAHSVYIPLEDIISESAEGAAPDSLPLLMQKACGQGRLYVWIPFKFVLPVTGEKVIEWCWRPQTKDA